MLQIWLYLYFRGDIWLAYKLDARCCIPFVSNGYFLFIHHVHQACDESFAGIDGILEVYFVYVGDVETDTLCVLCIIKYEWKYRLVHVYGVADFAYDILDELELIELMKITAWDTSMASTISSL